MFGLVTKRDVNLQLQAVRDAADKELVADAERIEDLENKVSELQTRIEIVEKVLNSTIAVLEASVMGTLVSPQEQGLTPLAVPLIDPNGIVQNGTMTPPIDAKALIRLIMGL